MTGRWNKKKVKLNPDVKKEIEKLVEDAATAAVREAYKLFNEKLEAKRKEYEQYADGEIKRQFEHVAWSKIRQEMRDEVERQMALMLAKE
ncbi:MAG: hypothetical protein ACW99U_21905 [Candidatus Thorarchaeota archaeon]